jgi:hypothetical protein
VKYFVPSGNSTSEIVGEIGNEIARNTEAAILGQLNDLISRGLLIVEHTQPILVHDPDSTKISVRTAVNLRLKDREYIESLERQLVELRDLVAKLRGAHDRA